MALHNSYLVVGRGHIGLATAAYLSAYGADVYVFSRRAANTQQDQLIRSIGPVAPGTHTITAISNRFEAIAKLNQNQLPSNIILCCRGQDVEFYARGLAPYLQPESNIMIFCASRFVSRVFAKVLRQWGMAQLPAIGDINNPPFVSRGNMIDQIKISTLTNQFFAAAQNAEMTERLLLTFQPVFKNLYPANSTVEVTLNKVNDVIHIPLLLVSLGRWELGEDYNPYQNLGPRTIGLVDHLDHDRRRIAEALGIPHFIDLPSHYRLTYGTMGPTLADHMHQLGVYSSTTVCNPHHRYLVEDLPYGVFPLHVLAQTLGLDTPFLDSCITICSKFLNIPLEWTADFLELDIPTMLSTAALLHRRQ